MYNSSDKTSKIIITVMAIIIFVILIFLVNYLINLANDKIHVREENPLGEIGTNNLEENLVQENITNETIVENEKETLSKTFGRVEIVWLDNNNQIISTPQKPILKGMTPVKYQRNEFVETKSNDTGWYNYNDKQWANAVDQNGSYFVWIPRYAYKIIYYEDGTYNKPTGYSDARGILKINKDGSLTRITRNNVGIEEIGNHYILHPAFMKDTATGYRNGGWDSELSGIWVAKYEMSMENRGSNSDTKTEATGNIKISDTIKAVSKPGAISWRNISIGTCYYNAFNYNRESESHLMKSSEWGAITYLAFSKYGRNTQKVEANKSRTNYTGGDAIVTEVYNYNGSQTTTGNATGIYDLTGGSWEYISAFINNGFSKAKEFGGTEENFLLENTINTKYKTIYYNSRTDDGRGDYERQYAVKNYEGNSGVRGDAIYEVSTNGYGSGTWESGSSFYMQQDTPFLIRGGDLSTNNSSIFAFHGSNGQADTTTGYRVVLAGK